MNINNSNSQIKLVIFDFDGTLCDSQKIIVKTLQMTQAERGYDVSSDEACAATIGLPLPNCFMQILPQIDKEEADACAACYRRIFEENKKIEFPPMFPHVMETIKSLHSRGIRMAIATSRVQVSLMKFVDRYEMTPFMDVCIGSDNVANPKPAPDPVLYILDKTGISAENTLVVGDMTFDILMGSQAGAHTCGVTYGNGTRQELLDCKAEFVIDDFEELNNIVK